MEASNSGRVRVYNGRGLAEPIPHKAFKFAGGEIQVAIDTKTRWWTSVTIMAHLTCSDDATEVVLLTDAIRRECPMMEIHFVCPYLPYARQDRVMEKGESLALACMAQGINLCGFHSVTVWDVHSDVSLALLHRVVNVEPSAFIQHLHDDFPLNDRTILVSPDAGANKKVFKVAQKFGLEMVRADKTRSTVDGSITGTQVFSEHVGNRDFLIVDDICDGGRTFIELGKELRKLTTGKVMLYVTHGIFSKGVEVLEDMIDEVFCALPFPNVVAPTNGQKYHVLTVRGW